MNGFSSEIVCLWQKGNKIKNIIFILIFQCDRNVFFQKCLQFFTQNFQFDFKSEIFGPLISHV